MYITERYISEIVAHPKYNAEDMTNHRSIGAVIKDKSGRILIQYHNKLGFWTIPVGKVLPNQSIMDGLKQEVREECNISILKAKEIANKLFHRNRDGIDISIDMHLFEVLKYSGTIRNNEPHKHKSQDFMTIEELKRKKDISDTTKIYLEYIKEEKK